MIIFGQGYVQLHGFPTKIFSVTAGRWSLPTELYQSVQLSIREIGDRLGIASPGRGRDTATGAQVLGNAQR